MIRCRLFDRLHQQHYPTSTTKRLNHFGAVEYMAKDLVDEEFDSASDYDTETSLRSSPAVSVTNSIQTVSHGGSNQYHERPESNTEILPSIEELTKSMQDLTERDLVSASDQEGFSEKEVSDELGFSQKEFKSINCSPAGLFLSAKANDTDTPASRGHAKHTVEQNITSPDDPSMGNYVIFRDTDTTSSVRTCSKQAERDLNRNSSNMVSSKQSNECDSIENSDENCNDMLHVKDIPRHSNADNKISSLQNEIEGLLAPLLENDIFCDGKMGDNNVEESCHNEFTIKKQLELGSKEYSEKDLSKRHCVTPSNTAESISETVDGAKKLLASTGSFIQGEKRARIGSLSNSSSTCSSSPFELCDTEEGTIITEHAIIESSTSGIKCIIHITPYLTYIISKY